jgi:hypothetical protein
MPDADALSGRNDAPIGEVRDVGCGSDLRSLSETEMPALLTMSGLAR